MGEDHTQPRSGSTPHPAGAADLPEPTGDTGGVRRVTDERQYQEWKRRYPDYICCSGSATSTRLFHEVRPSRRGCSIITLTSRTGRGDAMPMAGSRTTRRLTDSSRGSSELGPRSRSATRSRRRRPRGGVIQPRGGADRHARDVPTSRLLDGRPKLPRSSAAIGRATRWATRRWGWHASTADWPASRPRDRAAEALAVLDEPAEARPAEVLARSRRASRHARAGAAWRATRRRSGSAEARSVCGAQLPRHSPAESLGRRGVERATARRGVCADDPPETQQMPPAHLARDRPSGPRRATGRARREPPIAQPRGGETPIGRTAAGARCS